MEFLVPISFMGQNWEIYRSLSWLEKLGPAEPWMYYTFQHQDHWNQYISINHRTYSYNFQLLSDFLILILCRWNINYYVRRSWRCLCTPHGGVDASFLVQSTGESSPNLVGNLILPAAAFTEIWWCLADWAAQWIFKSLKYSFTNTHTLFHIL